METIATKSTVAQMFHPVKPSSPITGDTSPDSMIHHKASQDHHKIIISYGNMYQCRRYGVSSSRQILSRSLFIKKYDDIRSCLEQPLGLTVAQREVTLRLLRLYAYYGSAYPKESQITEEPGCSKATFWRTVKLLENLGLIQVINRYVIRPHAQISNLYRLDRLVLVIARYLAEHGTGFLEAWLKPYLLQPAVYFWAFLNQSPESRAGPSSLKVQP